VEGSTENTALVIGVAAGRALGWGSPGKQFG